MDNYIDPRNLSLISLSYRCHIETERYFRGQRYDARYGYELFRRALEDPHKEESKEAWPFVEAQYKRLAVIWVHKHWRFKLTSQSVDKFAEDGFARMWEIFAKNPGKFNSRDFPTLARVLGYLKMCVYSAIREFPLPGESVGDDIVDPTEVDSYLIMLALWRCIEERLNDDSERLVAYESFISESKPREIYAIYPGTFDDVKAVHRTKEKIVKRFKRNRDNLQECFDGKSHE